MCVLDMERSEGRKQDAISLFLGFLVGAMVSEHVTGRRWRTLDLHRPRYSGSSGGQGIRAKEMGPLLQLPSARIANFAGHQSF